MFGPRKGVEEIDKHKRSQESVGSNARKIIRNVYELRAKGSLMKGGRIGKGLGILRAVSYEVLRDVVFPSDLDLRIPDHMIIATAMAVREESTRQTCVVSRDINMRALCASISLFSEDYTPERAVHSSDQLHSGLPIHPLANQDISHIQAPENTHNK